VNGTQVGTSAADTHTERTPPMFETPITVVGRLVSDPVRRSVGAQDVAKFRLASNARRRAEDGSWGPGDSLFVNVNCWGRLVTGVVASLKKGDAVVVTGSIHTSEYDDRDGIRRSSLELRAHAVGPDLSCYVVDLRRVEDLRDCDAVVSDGVHDGEEPDEDDDGPLPMSA
jgi:single-strand DNA-binding protein